VFICAERHSLTPPTSPHKKLSWLLNKPDSVVSVARAHEDLLYGQYNFTDPALTQTMFHEHVVHKEIVRNLAAIIPNAWDEMQCAVDEIWGTNTTNWKDSTIFDDGMKIVARVSNRMLVGLPLCRDETYLKNVGYFASDVIFLMTLMNFVPNVLAPIFGRILSIPHWIHFRRIKKLTIPVIKARLLALSQADEKAADVPNDYITWHIKTAAAENNLPSLKPERIASSLMPLNFATLHTTTLTLTSLLFDIFSSDPSVATLLREEAETVYASNNNTWDKQSLSRLIRMDSAIRESMRLNTIGARVMIRKVIADEGLTNEEEGWTVPKGTYVTVDAHSPMHDPEVYEKPNVYDPFRFSRPREQLEKEMANATPNRTEEDDIRQKAELLKLKNTGLITTSDIYLPFGHGRHAW
jgi:cytochrome P450